MVDKFYFNDFIIIIIIIIVKSRIIQRGSEHVGMERKADQIPKAWSPPQLFT